MSTNSCQDDQAREGPAQNCSPGRSAARRPRECCGAEEEVRWPQALELQQSRAASCYPWGTEDINWCECDKTQSDRQAWAVDDSGGRGRKGVNAVGLAG